MTEEKNSEFGIRIPHKFDDMTGTERGLHINEALVAGTAEHEVEALLGFDERTIDEDLQVGQYLTHDRVGLYLLEGETSIAPDGTVQLLDDAFGESGESLGLVHRVAARKGDVALRLRQTVEDLIDRYRLARREGPCLGIMTSGTGMSASGTIDAGAPTRTIDSSIDHYPHQLNIHCCNNFLR